MAKTLRRFDDAKLARLRVMPVVDTLRVLGMHWQLDSTFAPRKDAATTRINVTTGAAQHELVVTGTQWYDTRRRRGGAGAIDLAMHLQGIDFVDAVKLLDRALSAPTSSSLS